MGGSALHGLGGPQVECVARDVTKEEMIKKLRQISPHAEDFSWYRQSDPVVDAATEWLLLHSQDGNRITIESSRERGAERVLAVVIDTNEGTVERFSRDPIA